jgi:hypothetical protein
MEFGVEAAETVLLRGGLPSLFRKQFLLSIWLNIPGEEDPEPGAWLQLEGKGMEEGEEMSFVLF